MDGVDRTQYQATALYSDIYAQAIMIELLALRSHFGLINDNARTYCEMSQAYIMPTSRRINSTPLTVDRVFRKQTNSIRGFGLSLFGQSERRIEFGLFVRSSV
jgi:hypothetical protein